MRVMRLCKRKYQSDLSGEGARKSGGRWNSPGTPMVYTASCGALAALEYCTHATNLPKNMVLLTIDVPDTMAPDVVDYVPGDASVFRQIGDEWQRSHCAPLMRVPSVLVPRQWNYLLNPDHAQFHQIQITAKSLFAYDPRIFSATLP